MTRQRARFGSSALLCLGAAIVSSGMGCDALNPCALLTTAVVTTDRSQLIGNDGPSSQAHLHAIVLMTAESYRTYWFPCAVYDPTYSFQWTVQDPAGQSANHLLDDADTANPVFSAGVLDGPYVVTCTATSDRGCTHTESLVLTVGTSVALDITADRYGVIAGGGFYGETTIHLHPPDGPQPYDVTWQVLGPDGNLDNDRLVIDDPLTPRFVSGTEVGTYTLTATLVDAAGVESAASVVVIVGQELGLDVVTSRSSLLPGGGPDGMITLMATPIGGKEPYLFDWEVIGPDGETHNAMLWDVSARDPIFESGSLSGQFIARCAVTDAEGTAMLGSAAFVVGQQLDLDVVTERFALSPGGGIAGVASLTADVRGGREPVDVTWSVIGPDGADATDLLSDTASTNVEFTSTSSAGRYIVRCTAEDADGVTVGDSLVLSVGGTLAVVVVADRTALAASSGSEGRTVLTAEALGGVGPFTYSWSVVDPYGNDASALLSTSDSASPTFEGTSSAGTYAILCTVADSDGAVAVDAVHVTVGQPLVVDVTTERQSLVAGGGVGGQTQVDSLTRGGVAPYQYRWSVLAPDGSLASSRLDSLVSAHPVFTSSGTIGTYRLTLTVTDALGSVFSDSVELLVTSTGGGASGQDLSVDVSTAKQVLAPADSAVLDTLVTGGVAPLTYAWTVTDPGGATDNGRLDSTSAPTVTFTSNTTFGTYRVQCTVTDSTGATFTDSIQLHVTDIFTVDLTASVTQGVPGLTVNLFADRTGGDADFVFKWTCLDSSGVVAGTFANGAIGVGDAQQTAADDVSNAWTAPTPGPGTAETYRITCLVTDAQGSSFSDSVHVVIDPPSPPSLELVPDTIFLRPGDVVNLTAVQSDGVANFDYTWIATDPAGAAAGTFATGSTGAGAATQTALPGSATNVWTAPAVGVASLGTYRLKATLTDAFGDTAADTIYVVVRSPLSLNVTASDTFVTPSTNVSLLADQTGGEPGYDYTWSAVDSSGAAAGTFVTGSTGVGGATQSGEAGDATNTWATASPGTYTIRGTVVDNAGQTFTDSITVVVTTVDGFSVDVTADQVLIRPGETVNLRGNRTGGTADFTYAWSVLNEAGASAGTFGAASQTGVANDTTNTWTAPTGPGVEGTYRISCTASDAYSHTFTDTVLIAVSSQAVQNVFLVPEGPDPNNIYAGAPLNAFAGIGDPGQQFTAGLNHPDYPRNIVVVITDANNTVSGGNVRIVGLDPRGLSQEEIIPIAASAGGSSTNTGAAPFAAVTRVDAYGFVGLDGDEQITVGTGSKFGLTGVLDAASDVLYVREDGTTLTSGYTVDAADGQQGITFSIAPDGTRNFTVVFIAR